MNTALKEISMERKNNLIVNEHHDPSAFDTLALQWGQLVSLSSTNTPFLTWQWQKTWWEYHKQAHRLRIITVNSKNGGLCGIAPLYSEDTRGEQKLRLLGGSDLCDNLDFIVTKGEEAHFCHTLLSYLTSSAASQTSLCLNSLPQQSPTLHLLKEVAHGRNYGLDIQLEDTAPLLDLPSDFDTYLTTLTKKNRHEIRRKMRRAEKTARISFQKIDLPSRVMHSIPLFLELFRKSAPKKDAFLNRQREQFFLSIAQEFSREGWLELFALSFDEKVVAYLLCFNYHGTLYLYNSAYDPAYYNLSPGIVAISYCLKDAINRGIKRFDFLRGNEAYKYHFGAKDQNLYTLTLCLSGEEHPCTE